MHKELKRKLILLIGILFILFGFIGLALPFLQGFLFIAIGIILLSIYSPHIRAWLDMHTQRYPKFHKLIVSLERWVTRIVGEL